MKKNHYIHATNEEIEKMIYEITDKVGIKNKNISAHPEIDGSVQIVVYCGKKKWNRLVSKANLCRQWRY